MFGLVVKIGNPWDGHKLAGSAFRVEDRVQWAVKPTHRKVLGDCILGEEQCMDFRMCLYLNKLTFNFICHQLLEAPLLFLR